MLEKCMEKRSSLLNNSGQLIYIYANITHWACFQYIKGKKFFRKLYWNISNKKVIYCGTNVFSHGIKYSGFADLYK